MVDKLLDTVTRYAHLVNPAATLVHTGEGVKAAPGGSLRLAKDPKTNMSLWNSIFVLGSLGPLAYLVNTLANKKHEAEVEDKLNKSLVDKLNALRPRLVADADLSRTGAFTELPKKELKQLEDIKEALNKSAAESTEDSKDSEVGWFDSLSNAIGDNLGDIASDTSKNILPFAAVPAAVLLGVGLSNYINDKRIKNKLKERRTQLRNIQAKIDRRALQLAGLVKPDTEETITKEASKKEGTNKFSDVHKQRENILSNTFIDFPLLGWAILSGALGLGAFHLLRKKDDNLAKIKYLQKTQLGSNVLQDTPQISVLDLPATPNEILVVPGDKKQQTLLESKPETKAKEAVALLDNNELFQEINPKKEEKDAIF